VNEIVAERAHAISKSVALKFSNDKGDYIAIIYIKSSCTIRCAFGGLRAAHSDDDIATGDIHTATHTTTRIS